MAMGIELFNMFARLSVQDTDFGTKLGAAGKKFKSFVGDVQGEMKKIDSAINTGLKVMAGAVTAVGTIFAKAGFTFNNDMEKYTTNFEVMLGDAQKAAAKVQELQRMAAATPFGLSELADATQTLLAFQVSSDRSTKVLQMLGDVALGNKEKMSGLALVYGQVASAGKLQGQDLMQMINQGFNPLNYIAKRTGESMEKLRDRMSKGKISIDEVTQAFEDATSEGGQFYQGMEKASKTTQGLWSTLQDDFASFAGEVLTPISNALKTDILPALNDVLVTVRAAFREVTGYVEDASGAGDNVAESSADWLTRLTAAWTDGKKESDEQVKEFIDDFKKDSAKIRKELAERRKALEGKGADTTELDKTYKQLDEYDARIEQLLKKKQGKKLSKAEQEELEEIIKARNEMAESLGLNGPMGEVMSAGEEFGKTFGSNIANAIRKAGDAVAWMIKNWDKVTAVIKSVAIALGVFKVAMIAVNLVMAANPIGLIIVAIGALIAAFTYFFETNEQFRDGVLFVWENLKIGFQKIGDFFKGIIDAIVDSWNAWGKVIGAFFGWFSGLWGKVAGWFKGLDWKLPTIDIPAALKATIETVKGWWESVKTWFTGLDWSLPTIEMPEWVDTVLGTISNWWESVKDWFTGLDWSLPEITMPAWVDTVLGTISGWWESVKTWFSGLSWSLPEIQMPAWVETVLQKVSGWWESAKTWFTGLNWNLPDLSLPVSGQQIIDTVQGWADQAVNWFKGLSFTLPGVEQPITGEDIVNRVQGWASSALTWFKDLSFQLPGMEQPVTGEDVVERVSGWANAAKDWFAGLSFQLPTVEQPITGEDIVNRVQGWADSALTWFKDLSFQLPGMEQPITGEDIVNRVQGWADSALTWFKDLSFQLPGMEQPVTGEDVVERVQGWATAAKDWFSGLSFALPEIKLPTSGQEVIDTISGWANSAREWFSNLDWSFPEITEPAWLTTIREAFTSFGNAIKGAFEGIQAAIDAVWPPKIKMPHFSVNGSMNPIDWFTQGVPTVSVSWYAKGGIFTTPTLFATPYGMKGVGEAGAEAVLPLSRLWSEMSSRMLQALEVHDAVREIDYGRIERAGQRPIVLALSGREIAHTLADENSLAMDSRSQDIIYGYGG